MSGLKRPGQVSQIRRLNERVLLPQLASPSIDPGSVSEAATARNIMAGAAGVDETGPQPSICRTGVVRHRAVTQQFGRGQSLVVCEP